jgi:hypothetical protein
MPLEPDEIAEDLPEVIGIGLEELKRVRALPPKESRKNVDLAPLLGLEVGGPTYRILAMIDKVDGQIKS